jgi:hypothetical protein
MTRITIAAILAMSVPLEGAGTLTLTAAGVNAGFTLSTFATINPGATGNTGPYGVGVTSSGTVLVNNFVNDTRYVFNDVDGQTVASALSAISPSGSLDTEFARAGGQLYGSVFPQFVQFNGNGTVNHALVGISQTPYFGMWGNPVNGHILATTGQGQIIDINPTANGGSGSATVVATPGLIYDGVTVSPNGATVYVTENYHVVGHNIANGSVVYDSGVLFGSPDGLGVISSNNQLNGKLIVNFNGAGLNAGFVGILDPATNTVTTIASGGTRGDYVSPDPTNGTVFLSYSDVVYRLGCGSGCAIGQPGPSAPPPAVPAPATWLLIGTGFASLALYWWRNRSLRLPSSTGV